MKLLSHVHLFATPLTVAHEVPLSLEFSRQEYWSGYHFLLQGIFLAQGSNPGLPHLRQTHYHLSHLGNPKISSIMLSKSSSLGLAFKDQKMFYICRTYKMILCCHGWEECQRNGENYRYKYLSILITYRFWIGGL